MKESKSAIVFLSTVAQVVAVISLQYSVTPSPNITTLQSAVFRCTLDALVPIIWTVNGTSSANTSFKAYISNHDITVIHAGTFNTTLTISGGDPALNATVVQCRAFGKANNVLYNETDGDIFYTQGPPASVDLYCSHQSVYTIRCNWIVPYTLPSVDITGYNINISNATSNLIMMTAVKVTEHTYNVSEFGNYTVSVVATIGELEGVIDTTVVDVSEGYEYMNEHSSSILNYAISSVLHQSITTTISTSQCCLPVAASPTILGLAAVNSTSDGIVADVNSTTTPAYDTQYRLSLAIVAIICGSITITVVSVFSIFVCVTKRTNQGSQPQFALQAVEVAPCDKQPNALPVCESSDNIYATVDGGVSFIDNPCYGSGSSVQHHATNPCYETVMQEIDNNDMEPVYMNSVPLSVTDPLSGLPS